MMRLFVLMIGPTAMILLGLQGLNSMLYTFALFYGWLLLIPLADGLLQKKSTLSENLKQLGFRVHKKNLKYGLILGIVLLVVIPMTVALLRPLLFDVTELKPLLQAWGFSRHAVWYIVILVVVNPLLEEIYWRCYMYRKLEKKLHAGLAIGLTSIFYSLYHLLWLVPMFEWPCDVLAVLLVFMAGLLWGWMYRKQRSLLGGFISHALADGGIVAVYLIYLQ
ncbi:CPBP family intramembrane glutamic endopeptidase [Paenibacillus validus]|uniref:CPBP family intramembrane glutamic endopeptidase n=1 Tax=Paenibacillus validus TaxID=44253 RepID=UPI003D27367C